MSSPRSSPYFSLTSASRLWSSRILVLAWFMSFPPNISFALSLPSFVMGTMTACAWGFSSSRWTMNETTFSSPNSRQQKSYMSFAHLSMPLQLSTSQLLPFSLIGWSPNASFRICSRLPPKTRLTARFDVAFTLPVTLFFIACSIFSVIDFDLSTGPSSPPFDTWKLSRVRLRS